MTDEKAPQKAASTSPAIRAPKRPARPVAAKGKADPSARSLFLTYWVFRYGFEGPIAEAMAHVDGAPENAYWWEDGKYLVGPIGESPIFGTVLWETAQDRDFVKRSEQMLLLQEAKVPVQEKKDG